MEIRRGFRWIGAAAKRNRQIEEPAPGKVTRASAGNARCHEWPVCLCVLVHGELERIRHKADRAWPHEAKRPRELAIGDRNLLSGKCFEMMAELFIKLCRRHSASWNR